jgi:hypothetical protein
VTAGGRRRALARGVVGGSMSNKGKREEIADEIVRLKAIVGQEVFDRIQREVWAKFTAEHTPVDAVGRMCRAPWLDPGTRF